MENLPEYKLIADDDSRRAAFAKFIKRQKVGRALRKDTPLIKIPLGTFKRGSI
jgi:hypothetical protein